MRVLLPDNLPKPSFHKVDDELSRKPSTPVDELARSFGYCNGEGFNRPPYYIRHTEPLDSDLMKQVEYDMDEQDHDWLQVFNSERQSEQQGPVSQEIFEVIMDQLEKEWFILMKHVPKPDMDLPAEDSCCAICDDGEGENSNAIVFCDGCNLAVHQDCYGVPYIPEGQWLCRKCTVSPEVPVTCMLCPNEGGAFKQTSSGKWAHLLCAIWIPEVTVQNQVFMEPIEHIENISKSRWKLRCSLCKEAKGACIQCDVKSCYAAFHVSCARKQKLLCSMKLMPEQEEQPLRAYCERHLPADMQDARNAYLKDLEERAEEIKKIRQSNKAARAYARTYKTGIPLVPQYIVTKVLEYINMAPIKKKMQVVLTICKYWSLKREARRGAPLLKRLHLEPWTTATSAAQQTEADRLRKLEHLKRLRHHLTELRGLAKLIQEREAVKTQQTENAVQILSDKLFPHEATLSQALDTISGMDEKGLFHVLGSKADVANYLAKIERPRSWSSIREKLNSHEYWDPYEFTTDLQLVWDNAISYYTPDHEMYQAAARLKQMAASTLSSLASLPTLEDNAGPPAAFEPAIQAIENLISGTFQDESEPNLFFTLMSSLGNPSRPLVEALVRQGRTSQGTFSEAKMATLGTEGDPVAHTPKSIPGAGQEFCSSTVISPPKSTPRARHIPVLSIPKTPKKTPVQRKQTESPMRATAVVPASIPKSPIKSPVTRNRLPPLRPYPTPGEYLQDTAAGTTDTASIASSSRKRKRNDYEVTVVDLRHAHGTSQVLQNGEIRPEGGMAEVDPETSASQKRIRRKTDKISKEEAKRIKREKEAKRRALKRAEAVAAALRKQEQRAARKANEGDTTKSNSIQEAEETNDDDDGTLSSTSSLTDLEDAGSNQDMEGGAEEAPKLEKRVLIPRAKKDAPKRPSNPVSIRPPRRNPRVSAPVEKLIEIPAGFKLQIGPGTKARPRDEVSPSKLKRESVIGGPPEINENGLMQSDTFVWAKQDGHPWFPGVIFQPDDKLIPVHIHETKEWFCESANLTPEERRTVQIVRFFDTTRTWAWLAPKSIRRLLDNEERDQFFLNARFRTPTLRNQVKSAYARALKEKGPPSETAGDVKMHEAESPELGLVPLNERAIPEALA